MCGWGVSGWVSVCVCALGHACVWVCVCVCVCVRIEKSYQVYLHGDGVWCSKTIDSHSTLLLESCLKKKYMVGVVIVCTCYSGVAQGGKKVWSFPEIWWSTRRAVAIHMK